MSEKNEIDADRGLPCLSISSVCKRFKLGRKYSTVLDEISLDLDQGEFCVILGPSGCGKSTLLNIIAGIIPPDKGKIAFSGVDVTSLPMEKRNFGMVFQNYALFPNLTVQENIGYGLKAARLGKAERSKRVSEMLELIKMTEHKGRLPAELSGGQQQRVALARALALRPRILLLDEPLSALDAQVRLALGQEILQIQRQSGVTALMVTHDQEEALSLADRVVLMRDGKIEQQGSPAEIYNRPVSAFAAEFVGHTNFIRMEGVNSGGQFGIRYEDVQIHPATESALRQPNTWVGKVERTTLMGSFARLEILLNDFTTRLYADVSCDGSMEGFTSGSLVAVMLPDDKWQCWGEGN